MLKRLQFTLALALVLCLGLAGQAFAGNFFVTPKIGTLGLGLDAGYHFNEQFTMRGNVNYLDYDKSNLVKVSDFDYDAELDYFTLGLLADWHPFSGGFRLTGGLYYRDLEVSLEAKAKSNKTYHIGDTTFNPGDLGHVKGKAEWDKFAPYLGIGYGSTASESGGLSFDFDLGVMYMSGVDVSYKAYTNSGISLPDADIKKEIRKIENDIDDFKFYPVVSLGLTFRF